MARVGAVTDEELQAVPGDQLPGGWFVVDGQGGHHEVETREAVEGALEGAQLGPARFVLALLFRSAGGPTAPSVCGVAA